MELITRKSECKRQTANEVFIKSPKEITKNHSHNEPKYCIIVKPFHLSFLPYNKIVFKGVTLSDDFSIELIRNNEPVTIEQEPQADEVVFYGTGNGSFRVA